MRCKTKLLKVQSKFAYKNPDMINKKKVCYK